MTWEDLTENSDMGLISTVMHVLNGMLLDYDDNLVTYIEESRKILRKSNTRRPGIAGFAAAAIVRYNSLCIYTKLIEGSKSMLVRHLSRIHARPLKQITAGSHFSGFDTYCYHHDAPMMVKRLHGESFMYHNAHILLATLGRHLSIMVVQSGGPTIDQMRSNKWNFIKGESDSMFSMAKPIPIEWNPTASENNVWATSLSYEDTYSTMLTIKENVNINPINDCGKVKAVLTIIRFAFGISTCAYSGHKIDDPGVCLHFAAPTAILGCNALSYINWGDNWAHLDAHISSEGTRFETKASGVYTGQTCSNDTIASIIGLCSITQTSSIHVTSIQINKIGSRYDIYVGDYYIKTVLVLSICMNETGIYDLRVHKMDPRYILVQGIQSYT
jgi:hypothetical protein